MSSSFFGIHVAATGLNASQAAINVTANNISNINTEGYSRQNIKMVSNAAQRTYQSYGTMGTGVSVDTITQTRDLYYDEKYWNNSTKLGRYDKEYYYMTQIENYFIDDKTVEGFSSLYSKMFNALDSLSQNAGDTSVRNEFISASQSMMEYFNSTSTSLSELQSSINDEVKTAVDTINATAKKIALLNKQINIVEVEGGHANELRDQRALLVDKLSKLLPVETKEVEVTNSNYPDQKTGGTYYTVKINGVLLVDNYEYNTMSCVTREEKNNIMDIEGLYDVIWDLSGATIDFTSSSMDGELKAMFEVRDGNNGENLAGSVTGTTSNTITISNTNITDIAKISIPDSGVVLANSKYYTYSGFTFDTDADGKVVSYTFQLTQALSADERAGLAGKNLVNGDTVDYKGIPYYQNQMNEFLRTFTKEFNDMERTGFDANGNPMGSFFAAYDFAGYQELDLSDGIDSTTLGNLSNSYYRLTAANARVTDAIQHDPKLFAVTTDPTAGVDAADLVKTLATLKEDVKFFRNGSGSAFLQCIYADITVDTQEAGTFSKSYSSVIEMIEQQRLSISSVDEDDEALNLVKFQNAYNLASKCISVLSEMYDQLILRTGV